MCHRPSPLSVQLPSTSLGAPQKSRRELKAESHFIFHFELLADCSRTDSNGERTIFLSTGAQPVGVRGSRPFLTYIANKSYHVKIGTSAFFYEKAPIVSHERRALRP